MQVWVKPKPAFIHNRLPLLTPNVTTIPCTARLSSWFRLRESLENETPKGVYTLVTLPRIVTPYRESVDEIRGRVTYQKLVTR
jgi:hypothetical protein